MIFKKFIMRMKYKILFLISCILLSTGLQAVILNKEEAGKADLTMLEDEIELFKSIGMGITLSIAHCEGNDSCALPMEEREVQQLIKTLEDRIDSLAARQSEIDDIIGFNKVLSAYISQRDIYAEHLQKMEDLILRFSNKSRTLEYGIDPDFPVEAAINQELLDYLNELSLFEDEELLDDEDLEEIPKEKKSQTQ